MAALNFPSSPTTNQVYTANGKTWTWNGSIWQPASVNPLTVLKQNIDLYVRKDGSDSNNGLTNNSAGAFLTIQACINHAAATYSKALYAVSVHIAAGTYTEDLHFYEAGFPMIDEGYFYYILGEGTTRNDVVIDGDIYGYFGNASIRDLTISGSLTISNASFFELSNCVADYLFVDTSGNISAYSSTFNYAYGTGPGRIYLNGCTFAQTYGYGPLYIQVIDATLTGSTDSAFYAGQGCYIYTTGAITLSGTPNYSTAFAAAYACGNVESGATYSGSATGKRYDVALNGVIQSTTTLPGNAAGTTATGGQYA